MSRITQRPAVGALEVYTQGTSSSSGTGIVDAGLNTCIGQRFDLSDGREVVLVKNGTTALSAGVLVQSPAETTAHEGLAITVPVAYPATAGSTQIYVTNGATVINENVYRGGYAIVSSGTGIGQTFRIASHPGIAASTSGVITLEDAIQTTLDATSTIDLIKNPYNGIIINPTTASGSPVGVSLYALAASTANTYNATTGVQTASGVSQYGLVISRGLASCLVDNTVTNVGYPIGRSAATAGAVGVATLTTVAQVGVAAQTLTSAKNGMIYLAL